MPAAARGRFIAIEGTDGSGKTVQFERLILALPENARVAALDFPRYGDPAAYFVERYLTGKYGGDVGPYAAAILFAADRFDSRLKVREWLREGRTVVSNRYLASSMAYQGARITDKEEREHFYRWLYQLEYDIFDIPKPDLTIVFHAPAGAAEAAERGAAKRSARGSSRMPGSAPDLDDGEADAAYRKRAEEVYLEISALFPDDFQVIECAPDGKMLAAEAIHRKMVAAVREILPF